MKHLLPVFVLYVLSMPAGGDAADRADRKQTQLTAEVAYTDPDRMQGLMHRRMLPENRGMLFVFRTLPATACG